MTRPRGTSRTARRSAAPPGARAEALHLDRLPHVAALTRQVCVRDRTLDAVAVAAARHASRELAVDAHRLGTERNRARVCENETTEDALRLLAREQRVAADEV